MRYLPESVAKLIAHFDSLPGIGPKHAQRLALYVLKDVNFARRFASDMGLALDAIMWCSQCQMISDSLLCHICSNKDRNQSVICVLSHMQDIEAVERTGKFNGTYHILHGALNPLEGVSPSQIRVQELIGRLKNGLVSEIIIALDATAEGEATALFLTRTLSTYPVKVTKLARGIPVGSSIEYTDEVTLSSALENRR